jgi:SynChlorMet cassette radical SAM/SPASM protein ScmF
MALQAVREAMPVGLQAVHLDGDDTLFYPELEALLDHLESLELAIQLETNGAGLTPPRASRLGRLPQSTVTNTFHAVDSATHDGFTGRPGAFDSATRAVRILSSAGLLVQVVYPVRRRSAPQIPALVKLVEELGGDTIRFVLPYPGPSLALKSGGNGDGAHAAGSPPSPQGSSFSDDILTVEELIALSWRIERELAYGTPLHLVFEQPPAFRGLHPKARVDGQERCGILNSLNVTPAGEYTLCGLSQAFPGLVLGRVGDDSLAAIWASHPLLQLLRSGLPDRLQGVCGRCTMKSTCLGECVIENKLHTGSFWSPGWFCEAAERVGLFPAGRLIENTW